MVVTDDPSILYRDHPTQESVDTGRIVCGDDNRGSALIRLKEYVHDPCGGIGIEITGRFVSE